MAYAAAVTGANSGATNATVVDVNHPYYIQNSDNPGIPLVTELLTDQNYSQWCRSTSRALSAKMKLGLIDGSLPKPPLTSPQYALWSRSNDMVVSWLLNSITAEIRNSVDYFDTAKEIWDDLAVRFSQSNMPKFFQLRKDICSISQGNMTITAYFTKFRTLLVELDNLDPMPKCNCPDVTQKLEQYEEKIKLSQFLMGLNDQYTAVRGQLLMLKPTPTLSQVFSLLLQEESQRDFAKITASPLAESIALNVKYNSLAKFKTSPGMNSQKKSTTDSANMFCDYCQNSGHLRDKCFCLHGYPEWHRLHGKPKPKPRKLNTSAGKSAAQVSSLPSTSVNTTVDTPTTVQESGVFSDAQCQQLSKMIQDTLRQNNAWSQSAPTAHMTGISGPFHSKYACSIVSVNSVLSPSNGAHYTWIIDSGATNHITCHKHLLHNPKPLQADLYLPDGKTVAITHSGTVYLTQDITLFNVLCVPAFNCNLISVHHLTVNSTNVIVFSGTSCMLQDPTSRQEREIGKLQDNLYKLCIPNKFQPANCISRASCNTVLSTKDVIVWHNRLGHPSTEVLNKISVVQSHSLNFNDCDVCHYSKQHRKPFPASHHQTLACFDLIHLDVWGPYRTVTHNNYSYFLTIVDDFSKATWVFLFSHKTQVPVLIKQFLAYVTTQFHTTVKTVRSDNGTEFTNFDIQNYFKDAGIIHHTSCPASPQQNGTVERKHQHLLNIARALKFQSKLPNKFWGDFILTATHISNLLPVRSLNYKTPFELLYKTPPTYSYLRSFGCLCYATNLHVTDKFQSKAVKGIFIGYPFGKKGYKVYDPQQKKCVYSRDVSFVENVFPYPSSSTAQPDLSAMYPAIPVCQEDTSVSTTIPTQTVAEPSTTESASTQPVTELPPTANTPPATQPTPPVTRPIRQKQLPARFKDFTGLPVSNAVLPKSLNSSGSATGMSSNSVSFPIQTHLSYDAFTPKYQSYLNSMTQIPTPYTFNQAAANPHWFKAMKTELDALEDNDTWELVLKPPNQHIVDCRWLFKVKYLPDGTVERYKARLVAKGFTQTQGVDYFETYAPVAKMITVRLFLSVAATKNWNVSQLDVTNAFLHGDLKETVYMKPPPGYAFLSSKCPGDISSYVCRLKKSLYGLKQAPRCWFVKFAAALLKYGFHQSLSDSSLFTFKVDNAFVAILVYVDDILITGSSESLMADIKLYLQTQFKIKDLGPIRYFLGIEVARSTQGFYLNQRKYALDLLRDTGLTAAKPSVTPIEQNHKLLSNTSPLLSAADSSSYRQLVGRLIYLTITRPDLSYTIHVLSQFMNAPRVDHMHAVFRVLRFIKQSPGQGLLISANTSLNLTAFCDADWGGDPVTRHSLTGYCVLLGNSVVSWKCKKQQTISRSSAEAEYRAMADTCCEVIWLVAVLKDLLVYPQLPIPFYCDSKSAIYIASNPVYHERTKHIEIDCHLVRENFAKGLLKPFHISTTLQPADMFTKAIGAAQLTSLSSKLNVCNLFQPSNLREDVKLDVTK